MGLEIVKTGGFEVNELHTMSADECWMSFPLRVEWWPTHSL
jgi:hypothetical protein